MGKSVAEEAVRIVAVEGHEQTTGDIQEFPEEVAKIPDSISGLDTVIEEKAPLQSMGPFPLNSPPAAAPQSSPSKLALILTQSGPTAPGSSVSAGADFDEEIRRILASLSQRIEEAGDSADSAKDLAFLESMAAGHKDV